MQIYLYFFWNFRNIQTATLIRKRIISALIDKVRNSTAFYVNYQIFYLKNCIFLSFSSIFTFLGYLRGKIMLLPLAIGIFSIHGSLRSYNHFVLARK